MNICLTVSHSLTRLSLFWQSLRSWLRPKIPAPLKSVAGSCPWKPISSHSRDSLAFSSLPGLSIGHRLISFSSWIGFFLSYAIACSAYSCSFWQWYYPITVSLLARSLSSSSFKAPRRSWNCGVIIDLRVSSTLSNVKGLYKFAGSVFPQMICSLKTS